MMFSAATTTRRFVPEGRAGALLRTAPALLRRARRTLGVLALLAGFVLLPPAPAAADTTAPTVRFVHPADGAPDLPTDRDLVITFSEPVRKGSGNIVIRPASGSDITIAVTDNQVSVSGRSVTIDPTANLAANTKYHVRIAAGAIEDLSGNDYAGIADATTWNFTTAAGADTTAPTVTWGSPPTSATDVPTNANLVFLFNEPVRKGSGNIVIRPTSGPNITIPVTDSRVTISHHMLCWQPGWRCSTVTIDPPDNLAADTAYRVRIAAGAFEDLSGNRNAYINDPRWSFTTAAGTDTTAPTVSTYLPLDGATAAPTNRELILTFSEPVRIGSGNIVIRPASGDGIAGSDITIDVVKDSHRVGVSGRRVSINPRFLFRRPNSDFAVPLPQPDTAYHVRIDAGAFEDLAGNDYAGIADAATWNFTTAAAPPADTTAPTFRSAAVKGASLAITFSEDLAEASSLANSAFTVRKTPAGGSEQGVTLSGSPSINGEVVTLTLATAVSTTDTGVKVSYTRPSAGSDNRLKDTADNEVATFAGRAVDTGRPLPPALTGEYRTLNYVDYYNDGNDGSPRRVRPPGIAAWNQTFAFRGRADLEAPVPLQSNACATGSTLEYGWYKRGALTTRLGRAVRSSSGRVMELRYAPRVPGEYLALAYCKSGTTWSAAVNLMRGGSVTLVRTPGAPTVGSFNPADGATGVRTHRDLVLTFNKPVRKGSGNIVIRPASGPDITIPVTDRQVSVSHGGRRVTIDPTADLAASTAYHVRIAAGAIEDRTGNDYAGIADATTWNFTTAADTTAPTVIGSNPSNGATAAPPNRDLVLTFSEPVRKGSGNIVIRPASGPDVTIAVTDRQVSVRDRRVIIDPTADLAASTAYHVRIASGAIEDLAGNDHAGIADATTWSFTTDGRADTTAPTPDWLSSAVRVSDDLTLGFNEPVRKGSGNIVIRPASGPDITIPVTDRQVSISHGGRTVTIDPTDDLAEGTAYHVRIASGAIEDLAGNDYAGIADATTWTFTTATADTTAPTVGSYHPTDGASAVPTHADLALTFNEPVRKGSGNIVLRPASGPDITIPMWDGQVWVSGSGRRVTIDPTADLAASTAYHVRIASGAIEDLAGNDYAGIADATTWTFTTAAADTTAPAVGSYDPTDGASAVPTHADLVLTFDEPVRRGSGNIVLRPASGPDITIPMRDAQVSVRGRTVSINPHANLAERTAYHVRIAGGAIEDLAGNDYAGIADATTWNFTTAADTTAPTLDIYRPANRYSASPVSVNTTLDLHFSEAVRKGSGNIVLRPSSGPDITIPVTGSQVSVRERNYRVSASGPWVTIDPNADLATGTRYHVLIPSGAFEDLAGNDYAGIASYWHWHFATAGKDATAPAFSSAVVDGTALTITFSERMDTRAKAPNTAFTVNVAGARRTVSSYALYHDYARLTLASAVTAGQAVTVAYTKPASGTVLQDRAGNDLASFTAQAVDITPPTVSSYHPAGGAAGVAAGANLVLTFSEPVVRRFGDIVIRPASGPDITIPVSEYRYGRLDDSQVAVNGRTVTINPAADLAEGTAYHVRIAAGAFRDLAGNHFAGIADATTWNFTTADTTAPALSTVTVSGTTLVLTYDEALDTGSAPAASAYRVKVSGGSGAVGAGSGTAPSSVTVSGSAVTLTLGTAVTHGQTVTVSYTKPGTNPVQDGAGNDAAALTDRVVTNTSTAAKPGRPAGVTAAPGEGQVTLSWTAPSDGGAPESWEYRHKSGSLGYGAWTDTGITSANAPTATSYTVSGLTAGTAYTFQVRAVNAGGEGPESAPVSATPVPASAPAKPAVTAQAGDGQVTLSWTAIAGTTGWQVRRRTVGAWGAWTAIAGSGAATAGHVATGLANGTLYGFQVRAENARGVGAASDEDRARPVSATGTAPAAPATLTATVGDGEVVLGWTTRTLDLTVRSWESRRREGAGAWGAWTPMTLGNELGEIYLLFGMARTYIVGGLANGTGYGFEVRAVNARGPGAASAEATATPAAPESGPAKPEGVNATGGNRRVTLGWEAMAEATGWEYQQKVQGGGWGRWYATKVASPGTATGVTVPGLTNGVQYTFRVRAVDADGPGAASDAVPVTPVRTLSKPPRVTDLTADSDGETSVRLTWSIPAAQRGAVEEWQVRLKTTGDWGEWTGMAVGGDASDATGWTVAGLTAGTAYTFQVRGRNAAHEGDASNEATATTAPDAVASVRVVHNGSSLTVSWAAPARATHYDVTYSDANRISWQRAAWNRAGAGLTITTNVDGGAPIDAAKTYLVGVRARNAAGESAWVNSAPATVTVTVLAPPEVTAEPNDAQVTLRWAAVTGATKYEYRMKAAAAEGEGEGTFGAWVSAGDAQATQKTVTELANGTQYVFEMRSGTEGAWSGASAPVRATPRVPPPGQPTVFFTVPGAGGVEVVVVPVANATGYEVRRKGAEGAPDGPWTAVSHRYVAHYDSDVLTLTGLAGGTYRFEVRAKRDEVPGPASAVFTVTVAAPPALGVADATAAEPGEGESATLDFAVTLAPAALGQVTVAYATGKAGDTATAGSDYRAANGTLTFAAGETQKTVSVPVLDDAHDEGSETLTLTLSDASGAALSDAEATGTITNADPLQKDWLARFGRAAAADAIAAVTARLQTPRDAGSHLTLGGQRLTLDGAGSAGAAPGLPPAGPDGPSWPSWSDDPSGDGDRTMSARELLMGTSFRAVLGSGAGAQWTGWGQGASVSAFSSDGPDLSLSGETATGSLGMDFERGGLLAGFAMTHSAGEGTAHGAGRSYVMGSAVTTMLPYVRYALTERVSAWGLAGTGAGRLTLDLDGGAPERYGADLAMTLAAMGVRGDLVTPVEASGYALALKADAFWVRTVSDAVSTPGVGNLAGARGDASRLRAVLDGSRTFSLSGGATLTPSLELGLRHDGGDAETGTGFELGAGLGYADPSRGLDMALRVHGLAAHAEDGYSEWGVSGSLSLVPGGAGRGLSASLMPSWGADPGGSERLWMLPDAGALAANGDAPLSSRLDAEVGYGLPVFGGGFTGTPHVGFGLSDTARELRLGWRLTPEDGDGFELSLDAARRDSPGETPEHRIGLGITARW